MKAACDSLGCTGLAEMKGQVGDLLQTLEHGNAPLCSADAAPVTARGVIIPMLTSARIYIWRSAVGLPLCKVHVTQQLSAGVQVPAGAESFSSSNPSSTWTQVGGPHHSMSDKSCSACWLLQALQHSASNSRPAFDLLHNPESTACLCRLKVADTTLQVQLHWRMPVRFSFGSC